MAFSKITFDDKEQGQVNTNPVEQQFRYLDANEIKGIVNEAVSGLNGELGLTSFREINPTTITTNESLNNITGNRINFIDSSSQSISININNASVPTAGSVKHDFVISEFTNLVDFSASGSQTIISKGGKVRLPSRGSACTLIYIGSNTWFLIGDLV